MRRHQGAKVKHFDFNNVIYHKFSHGAVSYTLNGENVNVLLEYWVYLYTTKYKIKEKVLNVFISLVAEPSCIFVAYYATLFA